MEGSSEVSMQLAGVLLKISLCAMIRFCIFPFADHVIYYAPVICMLVGSGMVSSCSAILANSDIKRYIASSSVIHMMIGMPCIILATNDCFSGAGSLICYFSHS